MPLNLFFFIFSLIRFFFFHYFFVPFKAAAVRRVWPLCVLERYLEKLNTSTFAYYFFPTAKPSREAHVLLNRSRLRAKLNASPIFTYLLQTLDFSWIHSFILHQNDF